MRKLAAVLLATLAVAGCGTTNAPHHAVSRTTAHPCSPANYYMQCAAPQGLRASKPSTHPVVAYGVDFGWSSVSAPWARSAGARFAASYLSGDPSKNWTRALVDAYHRAGLATVAVWETTANRALGGYAAGVADARAARGQATALGEPASRPVYFAVDFDSTSNPWAILPYFEGVDRVLGAQHVGAGYGGLATARILFAHRLVAYLWQTAAWSGGAWDSRAQIEQYAFGNALDWDRAMARDFGQWPYAAPKPKPRPKPHPIPVSYVKACSALDAITWWKAHGGHGHVSDGQHQQAVAIRKALARGQVGCTKQPHSVPYKFPRRRGALA